jgi:hypothetical protein
MYSLNPTQDLKSLLIEPCVIENQHQTFQRKKMARL